VEQRGGGNAVAKFMFLGVKHFSLESQFMLKSIGPVPKAVDCMQLKIVTKANFMVVPVMIQLESHVIILGG
jgi:hypothetical protein